MPENGATEYQSIIIDGKDKSIRSNPFSPGVRGWKLYADGSVEFASGIFRGELRAASGTFNGTVEAGNILLNGTVEAGTKWVLKHNNNFSFAIGASANQPIKEILTYVQGSCMVRVKFPVLNGAYYNIGKYKITTCDVDGQNETVVKNWTDYEAGQADYMSNILVQLNRNPIKIRLYLDTVVVNGLISASQANSTFELRVKDNPSVLSAF